MSKAEGKLADFAHDKARMESQVSRTQYLKKRVLESWKAKYEKTLAAQVSSVRGIMEQSRALKAHMSDLEARNQAIRESISNTRSNNGFMREALRALLPKMSMAHDFVQDTLNLTDDEQVAVLRMLREASPTEGQHEMNEDETTEELPSSIEQAILARLQHNSTESFQAKRWEELAHDFMLLQIGSEVQVGKIDNEAVEVDALFSPALLQFDSVMANMSFTLEAPEDVSEAEREELTQAFEEGDRALSDADAESHIGASRLKAEFMEKFQKTVGVKEKLLHDQANINATCKSLEELGRDLLTAEDFLTLQSRHLAEHLRVLKAFMNSVGDTVSAVLDANAR